jgi:hypothetical protein
VVAVVQFSGGEPVRAETIGAKTHPSYEALIPGRAIGTLPNKTMIADVFRNYFVQEEVPAPGMTRKVQTAMPEFVYGEGDMRFMPSDTDYLSAVKAGDTAAAQRMVDEAAEAKGYTVGPVYHRTSAKNITEFRPWVNFGTEEQATNVDLTGRGEGDTRTYRAFLNISNPIRVRDEGMAASNVLQQAREQGVVSGGEMAGFPYNKGDEVERAYVAKVLEKNGFDGIVYENEYEGQGDSYIALKPSQIKLADPVTRDDQGNVMPLSQRFQTSSADIRFMPVPDSSMPGAYSFTGGYRALPGKSKGSLRIYSPAGSLIGIAASLDEAQRIIRKKAKQ